MRTMQEAFNEWMRQYTEEPERFEHEFVTVERYLTEKAAGEIPTYGETCTYLLLDLIGPD